MADFILIIHFLFILTVIFGGLFVYMKPRFAWFHIPVVLWATVVNLMGWTCPLTPLENRFRKSAGESVYETGFIENYLSPLIYPDFSDYKWGIILGISALLWNVLLYTLIIYKTKK